MKFTLPYRLGYLIKLFLTNTANRRTPAYNPVAMALLRHGASNRNRLGMIAKRILVCQSGNARPPKGSAIGAQRGLCVQAKEQAQQERIRETSGTMNIIREAAHRAMAIGIFIKDRDLGSVSLKTRNVPGHVSQSLCPSRCSSLAACLPPRCSRWWYCRFSMSYGSAPRTQAQRVIWPPDLDRRGRKSGVIHQDCVRPRGTDAPTRPACPPAHARTPLRQRTPPPARHFAGSCGRFP